MSDTTQVTEDQIEKTPRAFSPITTQEDFDKAIKSRLDRAERKFKEEYKETFAKAAAYDEQVEKNKSDIEKANDRASKVEAELAEFKKREEIASWKQEVSKETGVPAEVLRGNTKEELTEHAESLKGVYGDRRAPFVQSDGFAAKKIPQSTRDQFAEAVSDYLGEK